MAGYQLRLAGVFLYRLFIMSRGLSDPGKSEATYRKMQ